MPAALPNPAGDLESLLAEALARFDEGGEAAMAAFVAAQAVHATALERGIRRCREMGMLGPRPGVSTSHPERLGEYRLLRRIGGGGMGVVYEAVQEPLERHVALKIIRPELLYFEGARERFRREIDAIAKLEHPAIVSVFFAGEHEGVPFFTMELIAGTTIEQACVRMQGRDPATLRGDDLRALAASDHATGELFVGAWWEAAVRVAQQIALGLRHAHLRGIVHRDVKPSNVMITPHGQAVVLDFGVAQVRAAGDLTRSGVTPGSPAYMSPEQRRGQATDERTDVFSLAASIWQLLTLEHPFRDADLARGDATLPRLRSLNAAAPPELDLVLRTAMDPERDRRYGDMAAFATDLQAVLDRRPIAARPLGLPLRALRWCQRHRTLATSLGLSLVALAAMLVLWLLVQNAAQEALLAKNADLHASQTELAAKNRDLLASQASLAAEQQRTRQSLDTSLEALHSVLVRLGNDRLLAVPQAQGVAHDALLDAARLFRELLAQHPDDAEVQWRAGRAMQALAMSFERQGKMTDAKTTLEQALAVLGDAPGSPTLRNVRGHAWKTLASWLVHGNDREATQQAIERAEADFADPPPDPAQRAEALRAQSDLCSTRSFAHDERLEPEQVERWLRAAVDRQRECMALGVANDRDPALLAMRITNLGKFLERHRRGDEALPLLEEAVQLAKTLPEQGTWPPPAVQLAEAQETIGNVLAGRKDPRAETLLRECIATRERAAQQFPDHVEFQIRLAGALHNHARFLQSEGHLDEALEELERARALQRQALAKSPNHPVALDFLGKHLDMIAYCHATKEDGRSLVATAKELAELPSKDPRRALRVADFHLRGWQFLGKTDRSLLDAAMEQLLLAEKRGLKAAQLPARGFEALEDRDDYREWRARVAARGPAK
jgi:tetratricopeptide (TPR) repeat protein/tRNA A-37 threonylcarbamoyl transferase component Bud32